MIRNSCGFVHLSDLHLGQKKLSWLWPNVKEEFYEDLKWANTCSGPWDLVMFTGDLVFSGQNKEFKEFDDELKEFFSFVKNLQGYEPAFLPVPGNHEIQRPKTGAPALTALAVWHSKPDIREEFWSGSSYDSIKMNAFAVYKKWAVKWRKRWPGCSTKDWNQGLLNGEFSVRLEIGKRSLGVVGLNSAFLDLSDDFHEGMLSLEYRQLAEVCQPDPSTWLNENEANFLLTHHPPEWFGEKDYMQEINIKDRFCLHLCGHIHVPGSELKIRGGGSARPRLMGASMFGLEDFKERRSGSDKKRIHGYSVGRLSLVSDKVTLQIWPRLMQSLQDSERRIGPDLSFKLNRSTHSFYIFGLEEKENFGDASEDIYARTARFGPKAQSAITTATNYSTEFDIIVAYSLDRLARGGQIKKFRENPEACIRVIMANVGDPTSRKILNRKFCYNEKELKNKFQEHLKELLGSKTKVKFDESKDLGIVQIDASPKDKCRYEVYITNMAITQSYYRVDDVMWILPLWMRKEKNPAPRVWELTRHRSPKSFIEYEEHFESLLEESTCVFRSPS